MAKSKKAANKERKIASARERADTHKSGFDSHTVQKPEGYKWWQPKEGTYKIDIIPFIAGDGNPYAKKGFMYYERTFFVHKNIGPDNGMYICSAKTYGEKCPPCEHKRELQKDEDADEKAISDLKWQERQIFLVRDHAEPDEKYIWDISNHCFGKALDKKIRNGDEGEYDDFFDPDDGYYLRLSLEEDSYNGRTFLMTADIEFKKRKEPLDEELVEEAPCLDDLLVKMDYKEYKKVFRQEEDEESDDTDDDDGKPTKKSSKKTEKPQRKSSKKKAPATAEDAGLEVGDTVEHEDHGECEIVKISGDGTSLILEDEDGEKIKGIGVDEVTKLDADDEPDEEEEAPKRGKSSTKKSGKAATRSSAGRGKKRDINEDEDDEPEPDDEESDDDEDEEPAPKNKRGSKPTKKSSSTKDDDWDDEDSELEDEDDDEPAPKKRGRK